MISHIFISQSKRKRSNKGWKNSLCMVQWINLNQNNRSVVARQYILHCEKKLACALEMGQHRLQEYWCIMMHWYTHFAVLIHVLKYYALRYIDTSQYGPISTMLLPLVGLMAGWLAGWQTKYWWIKKFLKFSTGYTIRNFTLFNIVTMLSEYYLCISTGFSQLKLILRCVLRCKNGTHFFHANPYY